MVIALSRPNLINHTVTESAPISEEVLLIMTEKDEQCRSRLLARSSPASRIELRNILRLALTFTRSMLSQLDELPERSKERRPVISSSKY